MSVSDNPQTVIDTIKELYFSDDVLQAEDMYVTETQDNISVKIRVGYDEIIDERMGMFLYIIDNCESVNISRYNESLIDISFIIPISEEWYSEQRA